MLTHQEMLFGGLLFVTVSALAYALSGIVFTSDPLTRRIRGRAREDAHDENISSRRSGREMMGPVMERIGHAAARPFMPKSAAKQSSLRKSLMHAGFYSSSAMELV